MSKLWFKRKAYGWGWYPATWQGWVITLVYIIAIVGFSLTIDNDSPTREILFTFILPVVLLTIAFIRIAKKKGETPQWQWGTKKDKRLVVGILACMALTALLGSYLLNEFHKNNNEQIGGASIAGYVHIGPVCPVVQNGNEEECADKPYSVSIEVHYPDERLLKIIQSGSDGRFSTTLEPGDYILRPQVANVLPACSEERVTVVQGETSDVDISCDSGIRTPFDSLNTY